MVGENEHDVVKRAQRAFNRYAAMDVPHLPKDKLSALQVRLSRWQARNFGSGDLREQTLGVCEEAGELAHAILKGVQGIRGFDDRQKMTTEAGDAIADCVVYLMQICTGLRIDFAALLFGIAEGVMARDWVTDPKDGGAK